MVLLLWQQHTAVSNYGIDASWSVPIKKMVSGIAMGLLKSEKHGVAILSDISGFEDAFGLMDFKVVGTEKGITAIQMDIKYKGSGLPREVFENAFEQAKRWSTSSYFR